MNNIFRKLLMFSQSDGGSIFQICLWKTSRKVGIPNDQSAVLITLWGKCMVEISRRGKKWLQAGNPSKLTPHTLGAFFGLSWGTLIYMEFKGVLTDYLQYLVYQIFWSGRVGKVTKPSNVFKLSGIKCLILIVLLPMGRDSNLWDQHKTCPWSYCRGLLIIASENDLIY